MAKTDKLAAGIPHPPGTKTKLLSVTHPGTKEEHEIHVPEDHDGSRIRVEFPDGGVAYTEGWDPAERALAGRVQVPCINCGAINAVRGSGPEFKFECTECGTANAVTLRVSSSAGVGKDESAGGG